MFVGGRKKHTSCVYHVTVFTYGRSPRGESLETKKYFLYSAAVRLAAAVRGSGYDFRKIVFLGRKQNKQLDANRGDALVKKIIIDIF